MRDWKYVQFRHFGEVSIAQISVLLFANLMADSEAEMSIS